MIAGVILAGGRSRRMGGENKPLSLLNERPLIGHVLQRLKCQCAPIIVSANNDLEAFENFGVPVIQDEVSGFFGPMSGIVSAMSWVKRNQPTYQWLVSVAADTPFIPPDLVERLYQVVCTKSALLSIAASNGRMHPVNALWSLTLMEPLKTMLFDDGNRKLHTITSLLPSCTVEWESVPVDPFFNINTPYDAEEAEKLFKAHALD